MIAPPKRAPLLVLLAVITTAALPVVALAQCPPPPTTSALAEGEIGLFFDPQGTMTCTDITLGVPFSLYVVARVPEGGVAGFVVPELYSPGLAPGMVFVGGATLPVGSPYDLLNFADACNQAQRRDAMTCPVAQGDLLVISVTEVMATQPYVGTLCFWTACPTIAGLVNMAPTYTRCDTGATGTFIGGSVMCVGIGEAPVAVESSTWGAIKARYGE